MQQIKQSTATLALVFRLVSSSDHVTPLTGVTPTVTLSKNGGVFASPSGAVTEIGSGFYKVAANATDSNTLGMLALAATASGADAAAMAYDVVANVESDSISAIAGLSIPSASAISDAVWDEVISDHATAGSTGAALAASSASGDPWATVVPDAYADGTAGAALGRLNNTPAEAPVIVIPDPDADGSLTVCYIYTESITGVKRAGIRLTFGLTEAPARSERVLEIASVVVKTDADGYAQISLQSGLEYRVFSEELKLREEFTPTGETFNILSLVP